MKTKILAPLAGLTLMALAAPVLAHNFTVGKIAIDHHEAEATALEKLRMLVG